MNGQRNLRGSEDSTERDRGSWFAKETFVVKRVD